MKVLLLPSPLNGLWPPTLVSMSNTENILILIYRWIMTTGSPPTMAQLAESLRSSPSTAHTIIHGLIEHGYLEQSGSNKTITFTEKALQLIDEMHARGSVSGTGTRNHEGIRRNDYQ